VRRQYKKLTESIIFSELLFSFFGWLSNFCSTLHIRKDNEVAFALAFAQPYSTALEFRLVFGRQCCKLIVGYLSAPVKLKNPLVSWFISFNGFISSGLTEGALASSVDHTVSLKCKEVAQLLRQSTLTDIEKKNGSFERKCYSIVRSEFIVEVAVGKWLLL